MPPWAQLVFEVSGAALVRIVTGPRSATLSAKYIPARPLPSTRTRVRWTGVVPTESARTLARPSFGDRPAGRAILVASCGVCILGVDERSAAFFAPARW